MKILKSNIPADFEDRLASHAKELEAWHSHMRKVANQKDLPPHPHISEFSKAGRKGRKVSSEEIGAAFLDAAEAHRQLRLQRHEPYPAPIADPFIAQFFEDDGSQKKYEIVNDDPTPEQLLTSKKEELFAEAIRLEKAELENTMPSTGKIRLLAIRLSDIEKADAERINAIHTKIAEKNSEIEKLEAAFYSFNNEFFVNGRIPSEEESKLIQEKMASLEKEKKPLIADRAVLYSIVASAEAYNASERSAEDQALVEEHAKRLEIQSSIMRWAAHVHSDIEDLTTENFSAFKIKPFSEFKA